MERLGHVLILGLGKSGVAAATYCAALLGGEVDSVTLIEGSDSAQASERAGELGRLGIDVRLGTDVVDGRFDLAIASPGIPPSAPLMRNALAAAAEVISELEFAYRRSSCPWVAVTGTNGKTTTTALVTHLLGAAGIAARSAGNIGRPAIDAVAEDPEHGVIVAEVSSFQLALTKSFRPRVAVLLNLTPDHIDWHGSLESYAADKAKVFANLTSDDLAIIDIDDPGSAEQVAAVADRGVPVARVSRLQVVDRGATLTDGVLALVNGPVVTELISADELRIKGPHNVSNALAAAAAAHAMGAGAAAISSGLATFEPIEHRLEPAGVACGAEWFNDSKATNPDAVFKALDAFGTRPLVLLLGGRNKGNDFRPLARAAAARAKATVAFGEAGGEIAEAFAGIGAPVTHVARFADAVAAASGIAGEGDAVVLSPACASFDEFENYEARGREFKRLVGAMSCGESR